MQFLRPVFCVIGNLCLALATYSLCRLVFFLLNRPMFPDVAGAPLRRMFLGGVRFALTAVLYTNLPYFVLAMLPLRLRERRWAQGIQKALFVTANFAAAVVNLCDTVYFPYTGRRTTATVFQEFGGESNLAGIFVHEALSHWYLVLLGLGILAALILLFRSPKPAKQWGWKGYLVAVALNAGGIFLWLVRQYGTLFATGVAAHPGAALSGIVLVAMVPTLAIAACISRCLYKRTGNIWAAAFTNGLLMTIMTVANTTVFFK